MIMNMRELEEIVLNDRIKVAQKQEIMAVTIKAMEAELLAVKQRVDDQDRLILQQQEVINVCSKAFATLDYWVAQLRTITHQMREDTDMLGMDLEDFGFDYEVHLSQEHAGLAAKIEILEEKVGARNKSAAVKRNMTDDDARRVLTGDQKDINHKEAGANIGLTYAQVYSCRMEFTFKHVHKELRDTGWKNPWKQ
jgi:hypothetical protein